jgi:hypothetical protein
VTTVEVAIADAQNMPKVIGSFMEMIDRVGPNPFKGL